MANTNWSSSALVLFSIIAAPLCMPVLFGLLREQAA
jgi:hypothetical protein